MAGVAPAERDEARDARRGRGRRRVRGVDRLHLGGGRLGPEVGYWSKDPVSPCTGPGTGRGAPRVHLYADVGNTASQPVAERAGFGREGVVRSCLEYRDGTRGDAALYGRVR
ncbi:N-acetyltransferase [Geodermatophilus sp. DF01-2]|uniref:GNAT family N-acetyltransferase n=1 Tax=Geodermatophilus sp. DF01-2 TaxID=2559610 RepID=UPI001104E3F3|nr:GNAT family protein [Geodermatophilus sp. DF01_2]TFV54036.1 N-acetyltransferase [Geodermatophilus sp. DF01_2]